MLSILVDSTSELSPAEITIMANQNNLIHTLNSMNNVMKSMFKYCHFDTRVSILLPPTSNRIAGQSWTIKTR
jgi:hypothetical protein